MSAVLTFPDAEAAFVRRHYKKARVILEYGSGGSTQLAASMPGKFVMSVESDRRWALNLQRELDQAGLTSPAIVWHVDIGPTGRWGRPETSEYWQRFHLYPLSIWSEPFFRHPDLILVDGRFRPACIAAACLRIQKPVTVLFDDYVTRPKYHVVERLVKPVEIVGRMARFELTPDLARKSDMALLVGLFSEVSLDQPGKQEYDTVFAPEHPELS